MKPSNLREEVKSHTHSRGHERGGTYQGLREAWRAVVQKVTESDMIEQLN